MISSTSSTRFRLLGTALCLLPSLALGFSLFGKGKEEPGETLWRAGEHQYLRLVAREEGAAAPNQHPVELSAAELYTVFIALQAKQQGGFLTFAGKEPVTLLTPEMAKTLSIQVSRGLARASAEQELIFVLVGLYKGSLLRDRKATGGRVFYRDGHLHLLLGDVLRSVNYGPERDVRGLETEIDRRRYPFHVGSRERDGAKGWDLLPAEGIGLHGDTAEPRGDWLEINLPQALAALQPAPGEAVTAPVAIPAGAPAAAPADDLRAQQERRRMLLEMARMRKEIDEMRKLPGAAGSGAQGSVAERLRVLESLREQELVSEQEYQQKRREILGEL